MTMLWFSLFWIYYSQPSSSEQPYPVFQFSNNTETWWPGRRSARRSDYYIQCKMSICTVICDDKWACWNVRVSASESKQLHVICSGYWKYHQGAKSLEITSGPANSATIECSGEMCCQNARFYLDTTQSVHMTCSSCSFTHLYVRTSSVANVDCEYNGCYETMFYVSWQSSSLTVNCKEKSACDDAELWCKNSTSKIIKADEVGFFVCDENGIYSLSTNSSPKGLSVQSQIIIISVVCVIIGVVIIIGICWFKIGYCHKPNKNSEKERKQISKSEYYDDKVNNENINDDAEEVMLENVYSEGNVNTNDGAQRKPIGEASEEVITVAHEFYC
eukprot:284037_1